VKTNVGHLEGAAGIAGLIKVVLCLQHGEIPPHLHFQKLNPHINFDNTPFVIPVKGCAWPSVEKKIAGVSSFGFGGTNAHVVLQEAPQEKEVTSNQSSVTSSNEKTKPNTEHWSLITDHYSPNTAYLLPLSARSPEALQEMVRAFQSILPLATCHLHDLSYTAGARRTHHEYRLAIAFHSHEELHRQFEALLQEEEGRWLLSTRKIPERLPGLAFVFSGQGPQWFAMGRELLAQEPMFRKIVEECDALLRKDTTWSLIEELQRDESSSRLDQTEIAQPALFALQVGLASLWRSWGIVPEAVVGHSVGEVAAAHLAGALSLADAVRVIYHRGRIMQQATGLGKMASVELPVAEAEKLLAKYENRLAIAAINSPTNTVISGEAVALAEVLKVLEPRGVACRMLRVNYAFHSPQISPFQNELTEALNGLSTSAASIPMYSTITGAPIDSEKLDAAYWGRNIRETVRFNDAITALAQNGFGLFVEVSPHPVLSSSIVESLNHGKKEGAVMASLRRGQSERATMLRALGELYSQGYPVDWSKLYPSGRCVSLPAYPWQRSRYWIENDGARSNSQDHSSRSLSTTIDASGQKRNDWFHEIKWQTKALVAKSNGASTGNWLIFADRGGVGEALVQRLIARGAKCQLIYAETSTGSVTMQAGASAIAGHLNGEFGQTVHGIVYLRSLDAKSNGELSVEELDQAQRLGCSSALRMLQALLDKKSPQAPKLWLVTRAAQTAGATEVAVAQSPLWGLGRVMALEHPELWGGMIDLPATGSAADVEFLAQEILQPDGEDQIAYRDQQRFVARLMRPHHLKSTAESIQLKADAGYLITGGLGSLGLSAARWLVAEFELRGQIDELLALEKLGAKIKIMRADVGDQARMTELFTELRQDMPPLRGIIHAAGVASHKPLLNLKDEDLQSEFRAKVQGAWLLHQLTRELQLDFFVLYSSISAVWGGKDLGHYAAANHFLDMLAHHRRGQGLPALSINWGPWTESNMAAPAFVEEMQRTGVSALTPEEGVDALGDLLAAGVTQMAVAKVDWNRFLPIYELRGARPLLEEIAAEAPSHSKTIQAKEEVLKKLEAASSPERREVLITHIHSLVAKTLGLATSRQLDTSVGFFEMGMDSIMAVELKNRLERSLNLSLPRTVTFEHPNVEKLAGFLIAKLFPSTPASATSASIEPEQNGHKQTAALADITKLSEDELAAIVDEELSRL
jgi:acyl transferase domain-containing protein